MNVKGRGKNKKKKVCSVSIQQKRRDVKKKETELSMLNNTYNRQGRRRKDKVKKKKQGVEKYLLRPSKITMKHELRGNFDDIKKPNER